MATTLPADSALQDEVATLLGVDRRPRWSRKIRWILALIVIAISAVIAVPRVIAARGSAPARYRTVEIARGDLRVTVTATGTLQTTTTVEVGAEVSGRIVQMNVDANDLVKKGQVLATIDPEQLRAAVDQATAQLAVADAAIRQAQATRIESRASADRAAMQNREGLISKKDLEAASAAAERAEASVASAVASAALARAALVSSKNRLDKATIVSPIDGIVLARQMEPGQTVTAGFSTPVLFKIAEDLTRMRLDVDVDEADVGRAREGQEASFTVDAYADRSFPSHVLVLLNEPKTSSNVVTYKARLSVDNRDRLLRPGMTATATIVAETKRDVVLVPNAALRFTPPQEGGPRGPMGPGGPKKAGETIEKDRKAVYVLDHGELRRVAVKVGASDGTNTEVLSNELAKGADVVVDTVNPE